MDTKEQRMRDCRLASRLQDQIIAGRHEALERLLWRIGTCISGQRQLGHLHDRLEACQAQRINAGIELVKGQLQRFLPEMIEQLTHLQVVVTADRPCLVTCNDLVCELEQLRYEFGGFTYSHTDRTLSVQTESIELQEEYLGPFDICLDLAAVGQPDPRKVYRVIAIDPHPAKGNEGVTHPHVSDEKLCEGEATVPIRNALKNGRLADFFLLVAGVLGTYNSGSAYVSLDQWEGNTCQECGITMHSDESYPCERCDGEFCSDCTDTCCQCDRTVCRGCGRSCEGCDKSLCTHCASECSQCHSQFCEECLQDGLCQACREKGQSTQETEENHETTTLEMEPATENRRALPALDPAGLGQTVTPA